MEPGERSGSTSVSGDPFQDRDDGWDRFSSFLHGRNQVFVWFVISFGFLPWLVEDWGASDAHYMVAFAGSLLVALLLVPVVGSLTKRLGYRPVLVATTLVSVVGIVLLGLGRLLGLSGGGVVWIALLFFVTANLALHSSRLAYGAFLPAESHNRDIGHTGGRGNMVGLLGSGVALVMMFVVLEVLGLGEPVLFVATGAVFLLLTVPDLLSLKAPPGASGLFRETATGSFQGGLQTIRYLLRDRVFSRFLLTRSMYVGALGTWVLVMGVYVATETGFERDAWGYYALLGIGIGSAALSTPLWRALVDRIGPRHTLVGVLTGWSFVFVMLVVHPLLGLAQAVFYLIAAFVGLLLAGTWTCDRSLLVAWAPQKRVGPSTILGLLAGGFAAVVGSLLWALVVDMGWTGSQWARQAGVVFVLAAMVFAVFLSRRLPDPYVGGGSPLARFMPWGDGSGRPLGRAWRLPFFAPFFLLYLGVTWFVFFVVLSPQPHADPGTVLYVPAHQIEGLYFHLPDLVEAPHRALPAVFTAPLVNVHLVQLVYVSVLLLLFGLVFEVREGPLRTILVFLSTSAFASIVAGLLHVAVYPGLISHPILEQAEHMVWTGGSAGAFGIMGATAARARTGWPLLVLFAVWELNVGVWFLRSYTPAFHLSALAGGFLLTRFIIPHKAPPGTRLDLGVGSRRALRSRPVPPDRL